MIRPRFTGNSGSTDRPSRQLEFRAKFAGARPPRRSHARPICPASVPARRGSRCHAAHSPRCAGELTQRVARDLYAARHFQWWVFDLIGPRLLVMMQKMWGKNVSAGNAPFQFGPAEGTKFFEPFGWVEREYHSQMDDARRLNRQMSMMWLWPSPT